MYKPICKKNQIILGENTNLVIVTGWTVAKKVAEKLDKKRYAAIGQLYSPIRGISFLVRNLLANPDITEIAIINGTKEDENAKACQALVDFFFFGVKEGRTELNKTVWKINSDIQGYIDFDIPLQAIEELRQNIHFVEFNSIKDCLKGIDDLLFTQKTRKQYIVPEPMEDLPKIFPGDRYGHRIEGETIAETWVKIIHRIKTIGTIRPTGYDGYWQELINLTAIITSEPEDFYFPEPNFLPVDEEFIQSYIPQILNDAPYQEGVKYTYGQRLRSWFGKDQIEQVIQKLITEIDAASAVMSLWDVKDHETGGSPCLNHIWVRVVENELSLTALFRSNDMFAAWPVNAMGLRALQKHILDEYNSRVNGKLTIGPLITNSLSAHIYDDCWENANSLIDKHYKIYHRYNDVVGNYVIELVDNEILVTRTTSQGEAIAYYKGKNIDKLLDQIIADAPTIEPGHAAYLGKQLALVRK